MLSINLHGLGARGNFKLDGAVNSVLFPSIALNADIEIIVAGQQL